MALYDQAFSDLWQDLQVTPNLPKDHSDKLKFLGDKYAERYDKTGALHDVEMSLKLYQEALEQTHAGHPDRSGRIQDLASAHNDISERTGSVANIELAIGLYHEALELTQASHAGRPHLLENLGGAYRNKYETLGSSTDIQQAIKYLKEALDVTTLDDPERPERLQSLGLAYRSKYHQTGAVEDLEEAMRNIQGAVDVTTPDDPERAEMLQNLGIVYHDRFLLSGAMEDLDRAIQLDKDALGQIPLDDPYRSRVLSSIGINYRDMYLRTGRIEDLDTSLRHKQEALDLTRPDHPDFPDRLQSLGLGYCDMYEGTASMKHLERSIELSRQSIDATPLDSPDRASRLQTLGNVYSARYRRAGAMADLEQSISYFEDSLDKTPKFHRGRADRLQDVAMGYADKYQRTLDIQDLDRASQLNQEALDSTPMDHITDRIHRLQAVGGDSRDRYHRTNDVRDLDRCIRLWQEALDLTPKHHVTRPSRLRAMGRAYRDKYRMAGETEDLHKSLGYFTEALDGLPLDYPSLASHLHDMANAFEDEYQRTGVPAFREKASGCLRRALEHSRSPIRDRLQSGMALLALLAANKRWQEAYDVAVITTQFVPLMTPQVLENSDKQHLLLDVVGLGSDAAAIALEAGRDTIDAIQLIELGRAVIAGSVSDLRVDVPDLQEKHSDLAEEYEDLRSRLDTPQTTTQPNVDQRHDADQKLQAVIERIRQKPGFDRFLRAPSEGELKHAAELGPIVIVNVSKYRCDALIIKQDRVFSIQLNSLRLDDIRDRVRKPATIDTLSWLWTSLGEPVLNTLGFGLPPADRHWPRLWWIPTGALCRLPIHAAGHHSSAVDSVLDRVISSYATSVKTVIQRRRLGPIHAKRTETAMREGLVNSVLIGMPNTPMHRKLRFAAKEIFELQILCESAKVNVRSPSPHHEIVIASLQDCHIFHFAGHGTTDARNPSRSALLLKDWETNPLMVHSLLETNLYQQAPFLAFLSACGTGRINEEQFLDESLHLIGGCQLAGFQHVIGTLWEVEDGSCVTMATETYKWILEQRLTSSSVSEGLHRACRILRDSWTATLKAGGDTITRDRPATKRYKLTHGEMQTTRNLEVEEDENPANLWWVAYVHYGAG